MHLQDCTAANLAMLTGEHPAERRSLSSTSGGEAGTPGSDLVCPSGVPHTAHVCVCVCVCVCASVCMCVHVHVGKCMHMGICCACLCVPERESACAQVLAHVRVCVCEKMGVQRCTHIGLCMCVCGDACKWAFTCACV